MAGGLNYGYAGNISCRSSLQGWELDYIYFCNHKWGAFCKVRKGLIIKYTWYANFTEIFPFLGILGTVASLVTYSDVTMMENFMVALSTTLLGVIFAAMFKGIDAILSGPMDVIIEDADHVIQEHERSERKRNAA